MKKLAYIPFTLPVADLSIPKLLVYISPKLPHSGVSTDRAWKSTVLNAIHQHGLSADLKVVCQTAEDVQMVAELIAILGLRFDPGQVWIMPEGISAGAIDSHTTAIVDAVLAHGFNMTTRLHVLTWGNLRGV